MRPRRLFFEKAHSAHTYAPTPTAYTTYGLRWLVLFSQFQKIILKKLFLPILCFPIIQIAIKLILPLIRGNPQQVVIIDMQ